MVLSVAAVLIHLNTCIDTANSCDLSIISLENNNIKPIIEYKK